MLGLGIDFSILIDSHFHKMILILKSQESISLACFQLTNVTLYNKNNYTNYLTFMHLADAFLQNHSVYTFFYYFFCQYVTSILQAYMNSLQHKIINKKTVTVGFRCNAKIKCKTTQ